MPSTASLSTAQQAIEIVLNDYDALRAGNALSHSEAVTLVASGLGVERHKVAALVNDRDAGLLGESGEQRIVVLSTPSATAGTAPLDLVPDFVPSDFSQ